MQPTAMVASGVFFLPPQWLNLHQKTKRFHQFALKSPNFPGGFVRYVQHNYRRDWSQPPQSSVGGERKSRKTAAQTLFCGSNVKLLFQRRAQQLHNILLPFFL